jgi:hypothetical protein
MHEAGLNDLTFPMLGHIVRDGAVVGVMTEASHGRLVEFTDRAAVYDAVARMQQKGIIHRNLHEGSVFITDSGVRFLGISAVIVVEDDEELEEQAQRWHWNCLKALFDKLKDKPFNDHPWMRKSPAPALLLPRLPSPNRSPTPDFSKLQFIFSLFLTDPFKYYEWLSRAASSSDNRSVVRSKRRKTTLSSLRPICRHGLHTIDLMTDEPIAGSWPSPSHMRIELAGTHHPYFRGSSRRTIRGDVTVASDTSDSTL